MSAPEFFDCILTAYKSSIGAYREPAFDLQTIYISCYVTTNGFDRWTVQLSYENLFGYRDPFDRFYFVGSNSFLLIQNVQWALALPHTKWFSVVMHPDTGSMDEFVVGLLPPQTEPGIATLKFRYRKSLQTFQITRVKPSNDCTTTGHARDRR